MGDVVDDANRETFLWRELIEFVEHRFHHCGRELLRGQPVASADYSRHRAHTVGSGIGKRFDHIETERLGWCAWLLGAIENRNGTHRCR